MANGLIGIALLLTSVAYGQSKPSLNERFDHAIRAVVTDAQQEPLAGRYPDPNYLVWKFNGGTLTARHEVFSTEKEAKQSFEHFRDGLAVGTTKLEGFADDAFLVVQMPINEQRLNFRRGRVMVQVSVRVQMSASGEESVKRFAALLLTEVDRAIRAREIQE